MTPDQRAREFRAAAFQVLKRRPRTDADRAEAAELIRLAEEAEQGKETQ